jgi:hypothetical protein
MAQFGSHRIDDGLIGTFFAHQRLGFFGIVPESGIMRLGIQPFDFFFRMIDVKDTSAVLRIGSLNR